MSISHKPPLLVLPPELAIHEVLFNETPIHILDIYLQCFSPDGEQVRGIPQHVLKALAKRFLLFMTRQVRSLDEAFGGRVALQRNGIQEGESDWGVVWNYIAELEKVEAETRAERGAGGAVETALERTAKKLGMSIGNVDRINRKARQRSRF